MECNSADHSKSEQSTALCSQPFEETIMVLTGAVSSLVNISASFYFLLLKLFLHINYQKEA